MPINITTIKPTILQVLKSYAFHLLILLLNWLYEWMFQNNSNLKLKHLKHFEFIVKKL